MMNDLFFPFTGPRHSHDCDTCRYRGSFVHVPTDRPAKVYDLYVHGEDGETSIIARFGSDGPEYDSFPSTVAALISEMSSPGAWGHAVQQVKSWRSHALTIILRPESEAREYGFSVDKSHQIDRSDEYGGRTRRQYLISWVDIQDNFSEEEKTAMIHSAFPPTRCTHSHDCCGHYYASRARITRLPNGKWLVRQSWTQNV